MGHKYVVIKVIKEGIDVCKTWISKFEHQKHRMRTIILDHQRIDRIIKRIAHQVVEHCYTQDRIIVVGIKPRGTWVADQIVAQLKDIAPMQVDQHTIDVDAIDSASLVAAKIKGQYVV